MAAPALNRSPLASDDSDAPPPYSAVADGRPPILPANISQEAIDGLNSAFASLNLPSTAVTNVNEDTCLAHLKLLSAFELLKEDVGYTDGLFNIFDSRATAENGKGSVEECSVEELLCKIREKRWALFVARAVDRYEAWWNTLKSDSEPLMIENMYCDSPKGPMFTSTTTFLKWTTLMLPPLDVLMVWHAHMLNPRSYLEDCMRHGLVGLWNFGMPWHLVNEAIDTGFSYTVSEDCIAAWENISGRAWNNADDPMTKSLKCPFCAEAHQVQWTTCEQPEDSQSPSPGLIGEGYGDGGLSYVCFRCGKTINQDLLEVVKFVNDVQALLSNNCPMPGTVLSYVTGMPEKAVDFPGKKFKRFFVNRLIKNHLSSHLLGLIKLGLDTPPSMETVRVMIETAIKDFRVVQKVDVLSRGDDLQLEAQSKIHIRKMMSRYYGNTSPFAVELGGAVQRQGAFTEKMHKIDWLHSPSARVTMNHLIIKYRRFLLIMATNTTKLAVPTLDVDLAWHTHQLGPRSYYDFTVRTAGRFIDHNDKIADDKLNAGFEWTSKIYQERYGEVYSECTCWYCETIRASHISSVGQILGMSKNEKIAEAFYTSGQADLCPPDRSAHISSHNAVKVVDADKRRQLVHQRSHNAQVARLEENYKRAQRRAQKRGRQIPPRDEYYLHWGYPYLMYGPWVYPVYYTTPIYPGCDPITTQAGTGYVGACAAGSCGGSLAAGACAGAFAGSCGSGSCGASARDRKSTR